MKVQRYYNPEPLAYRMRQLDWEWDRERTFQVLAGTLALGGVMLAGITRNRRWLWLTGALLPLMIEQALGKEPAAARALGAWGYRPRQDIEKERQALRLVQQRQSPAKDEPEGREKAPPALDESSEAAHELAESQTERMARGVWPVHI